MPMMNKFCLLLLLGSLSSGCCDEKPLVDVPDNQRHLLILIDKSQSTALESNANIQRVKSGLRTLLKSSVLKPGDRVSLHLIHGETAGMPKDLPMTFDAEIPLDKCKGKMSQEAAIDDFETAQRQFRKKVEDTVVAEMKRKPASTVALETDMLSTLEVISDFFAKAAPEDVKRVMYVSDMVHSQPKPRDYDKQPLTDKNEAEQCAWKDWPWAKTQHAINPKHFSGLNVQVWFPEGKTDKNTNAVMRHYWSELFRLVDSGINVEFF